MGNFTDVVDEVPTPKSGIPSLAELETEEAAQVVHALGQTNQCQLLP